METFIANGIELPTPKINPKYTEEDLQLEAWRDEAGYLHKIQVRTGLRKVELEWPYLTDEQLGVVRRAVKGSEYVTCRYYSDSAGINGYMSEAYSGDITYELYTLRYGHGEWVNVKVSIIER